MQTLLLFLVMLYSVIAQTDNSRTLELAHVIFRHGDRNPEQNNLYESGPYFNESFYSPHGYGQLIKQGKQTAYNLGKSLRLRYTGFLDPAYNIKLIEGRSSDFNRTKDSLQLVLAGLFPPTEELQWSTELPNWQPISFNYVERERDKELFCFGCPNWDKEFDGYLESPEGRPLVDQYEDLFAYVSEKTGENITQLLRLYYLYFGFEIQEALGFTLPAWTTAAYPFPLRNLTLTYYSCMLATMPLKRMAGGYLLKKIVQDTENKIKNTLVPAERKLFLYAGHENNIAAVLTILGGWKNDNVAPYGSYVVLELHRIDGVYGMKLFYQDKAASSPEPLTMPGCGEFCPFENFTAGIYEYISMDGSVCGFPSSSTNGLPINTLLLLTSWIIVTFKLVC